MNIQSVWWEVLGTVDGYPMIRRFRTKTEAQAYAEYCTTIDVCVECTYKVDALHLDFFTDFRGPWSFEHE